MNARVLLKKMRTAIRYGREQGFFALVRLLRHTVGLGNMFSPISPVDQYEFVLDRPFGKAIHEGDVPRQTINWFIPPFGRGSGGHLNIFRFVMQLEAQGFDCRIILCGPSSNLNAKTVEREISTWFFPVKARVFLGAHTAPPCHVSIATGWQTAYDVKNFRSTIHKCYFVQDFEPWFYAAGAEASFAEETYRLDFNAITAGGWLAQKLSHEFGMKTEAFGFSYDRNLYRPMHRREPDRKQVFFYARPATPRRAFELGVLVLDEVCRRMPEVTVLFAGGDLTAYKIPFPHTNPGVVDVKALADLYSQCDVALVLSFSNLSLLPLELMACGVPVVSNSGPYAEWLLNDDNSSLASPTVLALSEAVCSVLSDPSKAERLRRGGVATAESTDWAKEGLRVGAALRALDDASATGLTEPHSYG
jgi:glycosyltransferase involved in cell wall biosynthesis